VSETLFASSALGGRWASVMEVLRKRSGKMNACIGLGLALCAVLGAGAVFAAVQVLSDATLVLDGKAVKGHKRLLGHLVMKELLGSFGRAEEAVQKEDLEALMTFYSPAYNYHGLKESDVRRVWDEVFTHYRAVASTHLFSDIKVLQVGDKIRAEVTCTGGLYGTEEQTGKRITLDSWFREVHYLVKEEGLWRFLGNAGEAPRPSPPRHIIRCFDRCFLQTRRLSASAWPTKQGCSSFLITLPAPEVSPWLCWMPTWQGRAPLSPFRTRHQSG
jgi:hypothetical protein